MAVKITDKIKTFIDANHPCLVATADATGEPNVSAKGSIRVLDEEHLAFADIRSLRTRQNLKENTRVCVLVLNVQERHVYQLNGGAEYITSGPLYDQITEGLRRVAPTIPAPAGIVKIRVDEIREFGGSRK